MTAVLKQPILLDIEPHLVESRTNASDAAKALLLRVKKAHPMLHPHLIVDSAFGSLQFMEFLRANGATAIMSMPSKPLGALWEALSWGCDLESGRVALLPSDKGDEHYIASIYHVQSESG